MVAVRKGGFELTWMTWAYWVICLGLLLTVLVEMFREKEFWKQLSAAMIIIPLVLRVLFWK